MERATALLLLDAYDAAAEIDSFLAGVELPTYLNKRLLRLAIERLFEVVGEALSQASKRDPSIIEQVPHARDAINMRNWLIHGYNDISDRVVWATAVDDMPVLREEIRELLVSSGQWPY